MFHDLAPGRCSLPPQHAPDRGRRQRLRKPLETGVAVAVEAEVACGGGFRTDSSYSARGRSGVGETGAVVAPLFVAGGILEAVLNYSSICCAAVGFDFLNSSWLMLTHKFRGTPDGSFGVAAEEREEEAVAITVVAPAWKHVALSDCESGPPGKRRCRHWCRPNAEANYWRRPPTECPSPGTHLRWTRSCRAGPFLPSLAEEGPEIAASNYDVAGVEVEVAAGASLPRRPSCSSSSCSPLAATPPRKPTYP